MQTLFNAILAFDNMKLAWDEVQDGGRTAGVDGWTALRFQRHWERHLWDLIADVRANRYKPSPLRIITIPKRKGGSRRLGIPTLRDRILQRAALQVLSPRWDRQFLSCSYGYRPNRSLLQAVGAILRYRDRGLIWVLDADIDDFFNSVDLAILWGLIQKKVNEASVLRLLRQWLDIGVVHPHTQTGIAQGTPISPLFSNLFLHEMDWRLVQARFTLVRYADDFIILGREREQVARARAFTAEILADLKLRFEPAKTRMTSFEQGFDFLGVRFEGDAYSYLWKEKRVEVQGGLQSLWHMHRYFPEGYE